MGTKFLKANAQIPNWKSHAVLHHITNINRYLVISSMGCKSCCNRILEWNMQNSFMWLTHSFYNTSTISTPGGLCLKRRDIFQFHHVFFILLFAQAPDNGFRGLFKNLFVWSQNLHTLNFIRFQFLSDAAFVSRHPGFLSLQSRHARLSKAILTTMLFSCACGSWWSCDSSNLEAVSLGGGIKVRARFLLWLPTWVVHRHVHLEDLLFSQCDRLEFCLIKKGLWSLSNDLKSWFLL